MLLLISSFKDCQNNTQNALNQKEFEEGVNPKEIMQKVLKNCKKVEDDCEIFL